MFEQVAEKVEKLASNLPCGRLTKILSGQFQNTAYLIMESIGKVPGEIRPDLVNLASLLQPHVPFLALPNPTSVQIQYPSCRLVHLSQMNQLFVHPYQTRVRPIWPFEITQGDVWHIPVETITILERIHDFSQSITAVYDLIPRIANYNYALVQKQVLEHSDYHLGV